MNGVSRRASDLSGNGAGAPGTGTGTSRSLDDCIELACSALLARQHPDGHFDGDIDQGTAATAQTLVLEAYLGTLEPGDAADAIRWLWSRAQPDGGFLAYPHATFATMTDTGCAYAALAAAGVPADDPRRRLCRSWIEQHGGFAAADPITQAYLVMAGVRPASSLPPARIEHVLLPGVDRHIVRSFMLFYGVTIGYILPGLLHGLRRGGRSPNPVTRRAEQRIVDYLLDHQNPEGNWAGSQWVTTMALACLRALGLATDHEALERGVASLRRLRRPSAAGLETISLDADVWNTAMALRVLRRARPATTAETGWAARAIDYLVASQSTIAAPADWTNARPGAPRSGGWAFEAHNPLSSDADTTSVVLLALSDFEEAPRVQAALRRGVAWLLSMQHEAGGFGAFSRPTRVAPPGPLFLQRPEPPEGALALARFFARPPLEFVEIPTADLTSRVVAALARVAPSSPAIARATAFLYEQQSNDAWWGRWTTNWLAGSAFVLIGLAAAGERASRPAIARALRWIEEHRNPEGGFGETNDSYADPSLAGRGPSNAYLTGLVLHALSVSGAAASPAARRAAAWLVETQRPDGQWDETQAVQSMAPPELFYLNSVNFQTAPIEGLAVWRDALRGAGLSP